MKRKKPPLSAMPVDLVSPQPQGSVDQGENYKVGAWLMFGLAVVSLGFISYMVTIDKVDLATAIPATLGVVATLNVIVFRKPVSRSVRNGRRAVAGFLHGVAVLVGVPPDEHA